MHGTGYKSRRNEEREFRALENLSSRNLRNRKPFCDCREQTYLAAHALQRSSAGVYTRWYCRCAAIIRGDEVAWWSASIECFIPVTGRAAADI